MIRSAAVILPLLLAVGAVLNYRAYSVRRAEVQAVMRDTGVALRHPGDARLVAGELDEAQAAVTAARALLGDVYAPASGASPTTEPVRQLELAHRLALEAAPALPASWQVPMIAGGATCLRQVVSHDADIYTSPHTWERPLLQARAAAPGQPDPLRFLVAAKLQTWFALSQSEREAAQELLAELLARDPSETSRVLPPFLAVAASPDAAFAVVPTDPGAWLELQATFARRGDWQRYVRAREHWYELLDPYLASRLDEAREHLRDGEVASAREALLDVMTRTPPDSAYVDVVSRALTSCPPGPMPGAARALGAWRDWALDLSLVGPNPFPLAVFQRLCGIAEEGTPARTAWAALACNDLARAEFLERRAAPSWNEEWGPYFIVKSRLLSDSEPVVARAALERVTGSWRNALPYRMARAEAAAARAWSPTAWRFDGSRAWLPILPDGNATGVKLSLAALPQSGGTGAVMELSLDGRRIALRALAEAELVAIAAPLDAAPHIISIRTLAGGRIVPGDLTLDL